MKTTLAFLIFLGCVSFIKPEFKKYNPTTIKEETEIDLLRIQYNRKRVDFSKKIVTLAETEQRLIEASK